MTKRTFLSSIFSLIFIVSECQILTTIKDSRNEKIYKTVKIGKQIWLGENLNVTKFLNGDSIKEARSKNEWILANEKKTPAWAYYENNSAYGDIYGILYNWYAVNDPRGLAPIGWHIPTDNEWTELTDYLGGTIIAGKKMKIEGNNSTKSGFYALMAGNRHQRKSVGLGCRSYWWSSTEKKPEGAWIRKINNSNNYIERIEMLSWLGASVRCIKNDNNPSVIDNTGKIYLFSRALSYQFFDVDKQLVSDYLDDYFAIFNEDIDSLRLNLNFLSKYLLENNRIKYLSFELKTTNTTIKVFTIPKSYGDWYRIEIKSAIGNSSSYFIVSNSKTSKSITIQKLNNLIAYINYHVPQKSESQNSFVPIFHNTHNK